MSPGPERADGPRGWWPRSIGSRAHIALLGVVLLGLVAMIAGPWRFGLSLMGASFLVGAVLRLTVSEDHLGMLQVRGKVFDVLWMVVLGVSLVVLAVIIPNQPPL